LGSAIGAAIFGAILVAFVVIDAKTCESAFCVGGTGFTPRFAGDAGAIVCGVGGLSAGAGHTGAGSGAIAAGIRGDATGAGFLRFALAGGGVTAFADTTLTRGIRTSIGGATLDESGAAIGAAFAKR
jgi:hypothetical protein